MSSDSKREHNRVEIRKTARYDVELLTTGQDPKRVEHLLGRVKGLTLAPQALIAACPCTLATNISETVAAKLKQYLVQAGASVAIRQHGRPVAPTAVPAVVKSAPPPVVKNERPASPGNGAARSAAGDSPGTHAVAPTAITLKRSVGELTRALSDKDWMVREHAIIELGQAPSDGIMRHLIGVLKDDVWRVRCTALEVLSKTGSDVVLREIAKCVTDDVWHVRHQAVEALGRLGSDKIVKPLVTALHDPNWQVRQRAVQILGKIQSKQTLPPLLACLQDEVATVRESAAEALAQLKSEKAVNALLETLHDSNWRVRSMAVTALGEIGSEHALQGLLERFADATWMVHWKAAHALSKIGATTILPVLCQLEKGQHPLLGDAARKILSTLDIVAEPHQQAAPRLEYRTEKPLLNMRYIPAGEFIMGDDNGHDDAKPACRTFLPEFLIDAYKVTNAQYRRFDPAHAYPEGMDLYPVVNVSWEEAQAYAAWAGKRLPTEAQWEKAARGGDGRLYPWGAAFEASQCNTEESGRRQLTPVNQYPLGKSPFGVVELFGNVLEWTADRYQPYPWSRCDSLDFKENFVVLRGSSWIHQGSLGTCAARIYAPPANKTNFIGFRCVKAIE